MPAPGHSAKSWLDVLDARPHAVLDDWLEQHPELCRKVIVPARLKWEVRDKLDQAKRRERRGHAVRSRG
jgi:hypothetical protein